MRMSKKPKFLDQEIEDFFKLVEIPLEKDKDFLWAEKFEPLLRDDKKPPLKEKPVIRLYWRYAMAASFAILLAATFYFAPQNTRIEVANSLEIVDSSEQDMLADQTMIESLFVEDNDFDEWFEEQYVLSSVN